jgi:hypothetical protein
MQSTVKFFAIATMFMLLGAFTTPVQQANAHRPEISAAAPSNFGPLIQGTVTTEGSCKAGQTCGKWVQSLKRCNAISITLGSLTNSFYNSGSSVLRYRIYANAAGTGTPIADFTCNQPVVKFASAALTNNATFSVLISAGTSTSPVYAFTNGAFGGQSCVSNQVVKTKSRAMSRN